MRAHAHLSNKLMARAILALSIVNTLYFVLIRERNSYSCLYLRTCSSYATIFVLLLDLGLSFPLLFISVQCNLVPPMIASSHFYDVFLHAFCFPWIFNATVSLSSDLYFVLSHETLVCRHSFSFLIFCPNKILTFSQYIFGTPSVSFCQFALLLVRAAIFIS